MFYKGVKLVSPVLIDSGSKRHISKYSVLLHENIKDISLTIQTATNESIHLTFVVNCAINTSSGVSDLISIDQVLHSPLFIKNIISISKPCDEGYEFMFYILEVRIVLDWKVSVKGNRFYNF